MSCGSTSVCFLKAWNAHPVPKGPQAPCELILTLRIHNLLHYVSIQSWWQSGATPLFLLITKIEDCSHCGASLVATLLHQRDILNTTTLHQAASHLFDFFFFFSVTLHWHLWRRPPLPLFGKTVHILVGSCNIPIHLSVPCPFLTSLLSNSQTYLTIFTHSSHLFQNQINTVFLSPGLHLNTVVGLFLTVAFKYFLCWL